MAVSEGPGVPSRCCEGGAIVFVRSSRTLIVPFVIIPFAALLTSCGTDKEAVTLEDGQATSIIAIGTAAAAITRDVPSPVAEATRPPTLAPTAAPERLRVVESGFAPFTDSSGVVRTPWAAIVENPNISQQARDTRVLALFFDAGGVLLKTDTAYLNVLAPGQVTAAGSSYFSPGGAPVRMEVRVEGTRYQGGAALPPLQATEIAIVADQFFPSVTGKIANPASADLKDVSLTCIISDANGRYLAVGSAFLELLPGATTAVGSCSFDQRHDVSAATRIALFANYSILTLAALTPTP